MIEQYKKIIIIVMLFVCIYYFYNKYEYIKVEEKENSKKVNEVCYSNYPNNSCKSPLICFEGKCKQISDRSCKFDIECVSKKCNTDTFTCV